MWTSAHHTCCLCSCDATVAGPHLLPYSCSTPTFHLWVPYSKYRFNLWHISKVCAVYLSHILGHGVGPFAGATALLSHGACWLAPAKAEVSSAGAEDWLQTNWTLAGQTFDPSLSAALTVESLFLVCLSSPFSPVRDACCAWPVTADVQEQEEGVATPCWDAAGALKRRMGGSRGLPRWRW